MSFFITNREVMSSIGLDNFEILEKTRINNGQLNQSVNWTSFCLSNCNDVPDFAAELISDVVNLAPKKSKDYHLGCIRTFMRRGDFEQFDRWAFMSVWATCLHVFSAANSPPAIIPFVCAYRVVRNKHGKDVADKFAFSQKQIISDLFTT